jgi:glycine betaine/proline transport system ATP-binding protein
MTSLIEVNNLTKVFGTHPHKALPLIEQDISNREIQKRTDQITALRNVSFNVNRGEILVVMGLSGSGKSTLIRCLNRLIKPTAGQILIEGTDIIPMNNSEVRQLRRDKFGMVFQHFALFPHKTVIENAAFGLEIRGLDAESRKKQALEALELVGLSDRENAYPAELSGGMQQRVGLARALAQDPEILLMDEAFSALDPLNRREMQDELLSLQKSVHKIIVFITHDLDEAITLGDRIVIIEAGKVIQSGVPEEILTNPSTRYVERFVEHFDVSKVLTAKSAMRRPRAVAYLNQGPRVALRKMDTADISKIFVLDDSHKLAGFITAEDAAGAIKKKEVSLSNIVQKTFVAVVEETPLQDLIEKSLKSQAAIAVIDEENYLKGMITKSHLLAALANVEEGAGQS